jgi:Zn-dependent protease
LPENHACPRVGGLIQPGHAQVRRFRTPRKENLGAPFVRSNRSRFRIKYSGIFSKTEAKHVLLATSVMLFVGISLVVSIVLVQPILLVILVPGFVASFLGHELAHKLVAQRNGLWAEFRTNMYGIMLTAISVILPFKFLAPGQVVIQGNGNREVMGTIGLVGPGFNLVLGAAFFAFAKFTALFLSSAFLGLTIFNGWLAIINLIPFGSFDGTNVFNWDKTRWAISLVAAALLLVLGFYPTLV